MNNLDSNAQNISVQAVMAMIDHTLLKPEATKADAEAIAQEAAELGTFSICVSPSMLPIESKVPVATVCGFPSGQVAPAVKAFEAADAVAKGASEVDMVINIGKAIEGDFDYLYEEIKAVKAEVPGILKVIIESAALNDEQIVGACTAAKKAGADFVKTSTGFHPAGGATAHAVALMRKTVGNEMGVKASGGIRTKASALEMIAAGANRLGVSGSKAIAIEFAGEATATVDGSY